MTMFGNGETQAMLPVPKMLFDGEIEFVRGLNSRCLFCDHAATRMFKERDFWSLRCIDRRTFMVQMNSDGAAAFWNVLC